MPDAKIQLKVGTIEFSGEGSEAWLALQLDKLLEKAPALAALADKEETGGSADGSGSKKEMGSDPAIASQPLAGLHPVPKTPS
jgi:autotransporter translocation and assembly factor TamB